MSKTKGKAKTKPVAEITAVTGMIVTYTESGKSFPATVLGIRNIDDRVGTGGEPCVHIGYFVPDFVKDKDGNPTDLSLAGTGLRNNMVHFQFDVAHKTVDRSVPGGRWGIYTPPVIQALPVSDPQETGILNQPITDPTNDIVALEDASTIAIVGSVVKIDNEFMTVTDVTDLSNLKVSRASFNTTAANHAVGAPVGIWSKPDVPAPAVEAEPPVDEAA